MAFSEKDEFSEVHEKIGNREYDMALNLLCHNKTGKIRKPFDRDPNHAWYLVGDIFFKMGDYERAIEAFLEAFRCRDDDVEALWAIANCYSELHKPKNAEEYLRIAIKLDPSKQQLIYNLGNALFDQGQYEEALSWYEKVICVDDELYTLAKNNISACAVNLKGKKNS
ncbi:tetratricopeptide repeat protein [Sedimenticola sp.]|uniref:tetratricopeptide repeat protein n=1 Tax=Sedimenticola sp. TaxID=1940285 RepID=UPI003D0A4DB9